MKIIVHEDRTLQILNQATTQNENDVETIEFEFPEIYNNWNKKIVFIINNEPQWDIIQNDTYIIQRAITINQQVDFYIWLTHEEQDFRTETKSLYFNENINAGGEITPEELDPINAVLAEVDEALQEVENVDIDINKVGDTATIIIKRKDGTSKTEQIKDGEQGPAGYTPQKGIDYYTEAEKQELIQEIEQDVDNDIQAYINQPFANFEIVNGNLIAEVREWQ